MNASDIAAALRETSAELVEHCQSLRGDLDGLHKAIRLLREEFPVAQVRVLATLETLREAHKTNGPGSLQSR